MPTMRTFAKAFVATLVAAAAGVVLLAVPAQAQDYAWDRPVVTVKSTVSHSWGVARAVHQWNAHRVEGQPRLVIRDDVAHPDVVIRTVHADHWWTGVTTGSADGGTITHITIKFNLATIGKAKYRYDGSFEAAKYWTSSHELGHALGLEDSDVKRSVMCYSNPWQQTEGLPSRYDFRQLARLY